MTILIEFFNKNYYCRYGLYLIITIIFFIINSVAHADVNMRSPYSYPKVEKSFNKLSGELQILQQKLLIDKKIYPFRKNGQQLIIIDAVAKNDPQALLVDLKKLGLKYYSVFGRIISGQLSVSALEKLNLLASLSEIKISHVLYSQGRVMSQGDRAQYSDQARARFNLTGKGVVVAVISDSFNCLEGVKRDQATQDLPKKLFIVEDALDCIEAMDEGRALAQIVHDIAPDAQLIFHSGSNGLAKTANAILDFAFKYQVDIIVDDMKSLSASFYQEDIISQAIKKVTKVGVTYITAAGNEGRNAYSSIYREYKNSAFGINAHDFDSSKEVDIYQRLNIPRGVGFGLLLQWDNPAYSISGGKGAQTDLDIFIFDQYHNKILAASTFNNIGRDPIEFISFFNPTNSERTQFDLVITKATGPAPQEFKYIILNSIDGIIDEYSTNSSSIFGHANADAAITVGASNYLETPAFGVTPPLLQNFSSAGGQAIKFDLRGNRIDPFIPKKPDVIAPDSVNTTFFGTQDSDNDSYPNIAGSSAAAPHIAGVVALLLEANPSLQPVEVKKVLQRTAIDILQRNDKMKTSIGIGYDLDSGYGLVNAEAAVNFIQP